jgi:hypothetical protein
MVEVLALATVEVYGWAGKGQAWGRRRQWRSKEWEAERVENEQVWIPRGSRGVKTYVDGSAGDSNSVLSRRGQLGVVGDFIGLENMPTIFGVCWCEPKNKAGPQISIGVAMGGPMEMLL